MCTACLVLWIAGIVVMSFGICVDFRGCYVGGFVLNMNFLSIWKLV